MASSTVYRHLLDYTVTYRTLWTFVGVVFAFGVAGWFAWQRFQPPGPEERSRREISGAERFHDKSVECLSDATPQDLKRRLEQGRTLVAQAREAHEAGQFDDAQGWAAEAREAFHEFHDAVCATLGSVADIVERSGKVDVKKLKSPRWVPITSGTRLQPGDRIRVESGSITIRYKNGEQMSLEPGTLIAIQDYVPRAGADDKLEARMEHGGLTYESKPGTDSVLHTNLDVDVAPNGDKVDIRNPKGSDELDMVSVFGGSKILHDGTQTRMQANTAIRAQRGRGGKVSMGEPQVIPDRPSLLAPINGRVYTYEKPEGELTIFEWEEVDNAPKYTFQVGRNEYFDPVLNAKSTTVPQGRVERPWEAEIMGLPQGTYFWRIAAIDEDGNSSRWSELRRFTIDKGTKPSEDRPPPRLKILGTTQAGDKVIVRGETDPYVTLKAYVNDVPQRTLSVDENGFFQDMLIVGQEGLNVFRLVAEDTYGTRAVEEFEISYSF
ncbi:MAG: hypothetical protein AAF533_05975 [Acidobacteriota bacterium]